MLNSGRAKATGAESLTSLTWRRWTLCLGSAMGAAADAVVVANGTVQRRLGSCGFALAALLSVLLSGSSTSGRT